MGELPQSYLFNEEATVRSDDFIKAMFLFAATNRQLIEDSRREIESSWKLLRRVNRQFGF